MQTLSENLNILIVEDNPADQFLLEQMLLSSRLRIGQIFSATHLQGAQSLLLTERINLVILDLSLPDSFGVETLKLVRDKAKRIPVIILTGFSDSDTALEALHQGAQDYLVKGEFNSSFLSKSIEYSIERKKAEENIVASEEKYRQMFYRNPFPMWINDAETLDILEVNDAAIQKYGYSRQEFLELSLNDIQQIPVSLAPSSLSGTVREKLWQHKKKSGETIIVEFTYYPITYHGRTAMQAQVNDITENIRLENELSLQKQQMVEAVLDAQENERKNIGRELHDNINQILTAVKLNLGMALENREHSDMLIAKCIKNLSVTIEEVRKISKELILPGNLKELGLAHSIEELMKESLLLTNIQWDFDATAVEESLLSEDQKLAIYRMVQEQLSNIIKHASANAIFISLQTMGKQIVLTIRDNGRGFDTKKNRSGVGLTNIISRAELFNGEVHIESAPGNGCVLKVILNAKKILSNPGIRQVEETIKC